MSTDDYSCLGNTWIAFHQLQIRWIVMHLLLTGARECLQVYTRHNAYQVCTTSEYSHFTRIHASYRRILHLPCGSMVYKKGG